MTKKWNEFSSVPVRYRDGATWYDGSVVTASDKGEMESQSHPAPYRSGGTWDLHKRTVYSTTSAQNLPNYVGPIAGGIFAGAGPLAPVPLTSSSQMNIRGTSLLSRAIPTTPSFSVVAAVGELYSDGLPQLVGGSIKDTTKTLRQKAGNEYLNVEFGWLPLVSDIRQFAHNVKHSHEIVRNFRKGANRKIMRRAENPVSRGSSSRTGSGYFNPESFSFLGYGIETIESRSQVWFEGAFRYYVPIGDSQADKFYRYEQYANQILGTRLTPAALWQLAPWSWAVDWFTNASAVMQNVSQLGADGLVMEYGFVMNSVEITRTTTLTSDSVTYGQPPRGSTATLRETEATKQRRIANPYGFGIDDSTLSTRQLAILAALGLSKGKRAN